MESLGHIRMSWSSGLLSWLKVESFEYLSLPAWAASANSRCLCCCNECHCCFQNIQPLLQLLICYAKWHEHAYHIIVYPCLNQNQAALMSRRQDVAGRVRIRLFGDVILHQLHRHHATHATYITHEVELLLKSQEALCNGMPNLA